MFEPFTQTANIIRLNSSFILPTSGEYALTIRPTNQSSFYWVSFGTDENGEAFDDAIDIIELLFVFLPQISDLYNQSTCQTK